MTPSEDDGSRHVTTVSGLHGIGLSVRLIRTSDFPALDARHVNAV